MSKYASLYPAERRIFPTVRVYEAAVVPDGKIRYAVGRGEHMDYSKIGALIRRLRQERKMTQRELAQTLGLSPKTVSKWERGVSHS